MATITNTELVEFRNAAQRYINLHPERTKLHYALEKMLKKTLAAFEDFSDAENEIRMDCALVDQNTKAFIVAEDKKSYTVDSTKAKDQVSRLRALSRKAVTIDPFLVSDYPKDLEAMWYSYFNGIVLDELNDPALAESKRNEPVKTDK